MTFKHIKLALTVFIIQDVIIGIYLLVSHHTLFYWDPQIIDSVHHVIIISFAIFAIQYKRSLYIKSYHSVLHLFTSSSVKLNKLRWYHFIIPMCLAIVIAETIRFMFYYFSSNISTYLFNFHHLLNFHHLSNILIIYNIVGGDLIAVLLLIMLTIQVSSVKLMNYAIKLPLSDDTLIYQQPYQLLIDNNFKSALLIIVLILLYSVHVILITNAHWIILVFTSFDVVCIGALVLNPSLKLSNKVKSARNRFKTKLLKRAHLRLRAGLPVNLDKTAAISKLKDECNVFNVINNYVTLVLSDYDQSKKARITSFYMQAIVAILSPLIIKIVIDVATKSSHMFY